MDQEFDDFVLEWKRLTLDVRERDGEAALLEATGAGTPFFNEVAGLLGFSYDAEQARYVLEEGICDGWADYCAKAREMFGESGVVQSGRVKLTPLGDLGPAGLTVDAEKPVTLQEVVAASGKPLVFEGLQGLYGAHRGVSDFYERTRVALEGAIASSEPFDTGWYGVKHELQSGRVAGDGKGNFVCYASVTDDFDTLGRGRTNLWLGEVAMEDAFYAIVGGLDKAVDLAEENRRENQLYQGYSILNAKGGWVETYLVDVMGGFSEPPGDVYTEWGFQGECELSEEVKAAIEQWINGRPGDHETLQAGGFTVRSWDYGEAMELMEDDGHAALAARRREKAAERGFLAPDPAGEDASEGALQSP